jgi:hypothetical protein
LNEPSGGESFQNLSGHVGDVLTRELHRRAAISSLTARSVILYIEMF